MITLPTEKGEVTRSNPRLFILYAPPKCGKTTLVSTLPGNLILDLEGGTEYVEAMSMNIIGWEPPVNESAEDADQRHQLGRFYMTEAGKAIITEGRPYEFLTIDTATALEDIVKPIAVKMYKETPMGGSFDGDDVLTLPRGAGYYWLREAYKSALEKITKLADNIILVGHLKDTFVTKEGKEVQAKDLDLTGKIKQITCASADAVGYLHRGSNGELLINFKSSDEVLCGSRCPQLRGKEIQIADYDEETNDLKNIRWDIIYPDTFKDAINK